MRGLPDESLQLSLRVKREHILPMEVVAAPLVASRRWWDTAAIVVSESARTDVRNPRVERRIRPASPDVPRSVLFLAGIVWSLSGMSLPSIGIREWLGYATGSPAPGLRTSNIKRS